MELQAGSTLITIKMQNPRCARLQAIQSGI